MEHTDIKKLADLARIDLSEEETAELADDLKQILSYVDQLSSVDVSVEDEKPAVYNQVRKDEHPEPAGTHVKKATDAFPEEKDGFLRVKQVMK